jgi:uncharacterized protein YdaU (DUF1376 family)
LNYYERHIGDYLKDTAHLSLLEHGIYGRLLDIYYTREEPIPEAQVMRLVGARSDEEKSSVRDVLNEFFTRDGDEWRHTRCDREIDRYQDKQRKAKASADARWSKDKPQTDRNADAMRTHSEGNAPSNQTPVTSNTPPTPSRGGVVLPDGFEDWWQEFPPTPRKVAKAQCAAKWKRQGCDQNPASVLAALRAAKASDEWTKDGGQFIPAPLVWLNQRRWEAFTETQAQAKPGTPEYFAQHRRAAWWQDAGFASVEDAHNNRCWHGNASEFVNGTRGNS